MSYNHVMLGEPKQSPRIDVQKAVKQFGGNQYLMILTAAYRAYEIHRRRTYAERSAQKRIPYEYKPINEALKEVVEGKLTLDYIQEKSHGNTRRKNSSK